MCALCSVHCAATATSGASNNYFQPFSKTLGMILKVKTLWSDLVSLKVTNQDKAAWGYHAFPSWI